MRASPTIVSIFVLIALEMNMAENRDQASGKEVRGLRADDTQCVVRACMETRFFSSRATFPAHRNGMVFLFHRCTESLNGTRDIFTY